MKRICIFLLTFASVSRSYGILPIFQKESRYDQQQIGIDFSQFIYFTMPGKKGFNAGVFYQYQPFRFLSVNTSLFVNNVYSQRNRGKYKELIDYKSSGACFKVGLELSLRISKNKISRVFCGLQEALINNRESGRFFVDGLYWGTHERVYQIPARNYWATELITGFQFGNRNERWVFRPQAYFIFTKHDNRISNHPEVVEGYWSPFIPGFGFMRGGINCILLYRINTCLGDSDLDKVQGNHSIP